MTLTAEQIEIRKTGIGSSDIGAIAGLSSYEPSSPYYRGPFDVWLEKTGKSTKDQPNEFAEIGHMLEPIIGQMYAQRQPQPFALLANRETLTHKEHAWMLATVDFYAMPVNTPEWIVEAKNRSARQEPKWGLSGTDEVTQDVAAQCFWQMAVTGLDRVDVPVLFGGNDFRVYRIHRQPMIIARLMEIGQEFWAKHVVTDIPPALDGSERVKQYLAQTFDQHSDAIEPATVEEDALIFSLENVRQMKDYQQAEDDRLCNLLRAAIGDRAGIIGPSGKVTWKKSKDAQKTDWEAVAKDLGSLHADELREAIARHTKAVPGARRFLPTFPKGDK